jgi:hypothetical protein
LNRVSRSVILTIVSELFSWRNIGRQLLID